MAPFRLTPRECARLSELISVSEQARVFRRAQALLWLAEGDSPSEVAERLGVSRQTLYNWASRFQDRDELPLRERLAEGPRSGRPRTASGIIDPLLDEILEDAPRQWGYHATVWTAPLLRQYRDDVHGIAVSRPSVSAARDRLGIRWKRPRPCLARRPDTWRQAQGG